MATAEQIAREQKSSATDYFCISSSASHYISIESDGIFCSPHFVVKEHELRAWQSAGVMGKVWPAGIFCSPHFVLRNGVAAKQPHSSRL